MRASEWSDYLYMPGTTETDFTGVPEPEYTAPKRWRPARWRRHLPGGPFRCAGNWQPNI